MGASPRNTDSVAGNLITIGMNLSEPILVADAVLIVRGLFRASPGPTDLNLVLHSRYWHRSRKNAQQCARIVAGKLAVKDLRPRASKVDAWIGTSEESDPHITRIMSI